VKFSRIFLTALAATLLFSTLAVSAFGSELVDKIVVIVNEEIITLSDVADFENRLKTGGLVDDQLVPDDATRQSLLKDRDLLVKKLIDARLIDAEVKKQNLTVPIERVEQEVRSIAKRNNMQRDDLKNALLEKGISFAVYQDFIKTGLERQSLVEKSVTSKIKISEDDVLAALIAEGRTSDTQAFEYSIAHIYFLSSKSGGVSGARARANQALEKLKSGSPFDRVAADFSEDPNFDVGGVLGTFKSGELAPELEKAIAKLAPGEWTEPLPTNGGLHIVRMIKRRLIPDPRIEKEKDAARARLGEKAFRRQYEIWLELLRSEASIRINK
jgi:peptidyl-prolyl cis-trans isomerase SurA